MVSKTGGNGITAQRDAFQGCSGLLEQRRNTDLFSPEQDRDKMTFSLCIYSPDHLTAVISATESMQLDQMENKPKVISKS